MNISKKLPGPRFNFVLFRKSDDFEDEHNRIPNLKS
jgi:hypothetical protein